MISLRKTYTGQTYLQETMASLKEKDVYVSYENEAGICHGIAIMGLLAFYSKDIESFNQRIDYIYSLHQSKINLKEKIELLQWNLRNEKRSILYPEEEKLINAWIFFDAIALLQSPEKYYQIFGKKLAQSQSDEVAKLIASHAIRKRGGLKRIESWKEFYELPELEKYLEKMTAAAKNCNSSIGLLLNTGPVNRTYGHAMSLCWDNQKRIWLFINANGLPISQFKENQLSSLAKAIFSGFMDKDITYFETILYSTGYEESKAWQFFHQLKAIHSPPPALHEKIYKLTQWDLFNNICKAVFNNNASLLQNALNNIDTNVLNLNQSDLNYEKNPFHYAIELNHFDCFKALFPYVAINTRAANGKTALHIAIETKNAEIFTLLIKCGADINIIDNNGNSSLDLMSTCYDNEKIMTFFIQHCEDKNKLKLLRNPLSNNNTMLHLLNTKIYSMEATEYYQNNKKNHDHRKSHHKKEPKPKKKIIEEKMSKLSFFHRSNKRKNENDEVVFFQKKVKYTLT